MPGSMADVIITNGAFTVQPLQGSVQRQSAGYLAAGQTAKSYVGTGLVPVTTAAPGAPTLAAGAAGNPNGAYFARVTFVSANGESQGGATATITVASLQIAWSAIPTGPTGTTQRKLYRTAAGGLAGTEKLVTTIADNTTTNFTDNVADGSLGVACPVRNTWAAALSIALGTVTALKTWIATDIFLSTDSATPIDVQLQAAASPIFRKLFQATAPVDAAGIETQPNAAAGNALTLVVQGAPAVATVVYDIMAIEQ